MRPCLFILERCWAMLGQLGAILKQLGDKMWPKSAKMSQDRAGSAPKGGQMSQDSEEIRAGRGSAEGGGTPLYGYPPGKDFREGKEITH